MRLKFLMSLLLIAAINFKVSAQDAEKKSPEFRAQKMTEKMAEKLELNEQQKEAMYKLNLEMVQKKMEEQKRHKEQRAAYLKEVEKVLDETQYTQFKKHLERKVKEKHKMKKHHRGLKHKEADEG